MSAMFREIEVYTRGRGRQMKRCCVYSILGIFGNRTSGGLSMLWWVQDKTGHRRGPLRASQITRLISIGSFDVLGNVIAEGAADWICMASSKSLAEELTREQSEMGGIDSDSRVRIPLANVPPTECVPCCDPACPIGSGCDVIYIWDRKWEMYLTYDEYVQVCIEDGLTDGLPERSLPSTSEQIQELLTEADRPRMVIPRRELHRNNKKELSSSEDEPLSDPEKEAKRQRKRAYRERKKLKRDAGLWVKSKNNPNVYISGLPSDITIDELGSLFKQAGQIKIDPQTANLRIRVYGHGDALVSYMHQESVALAISLFNETEIRPGIHLCVQQADFSESTTNATTNSLSTDQLRELAQLNRAKRQKLVEFQRKERALKSVWDVADYGIGSTHRPVVVFSNCFDPRTGDQPDYDFIESEIEKFCAPLEIKKITSIRNSIDGYVCVRFTNPRDAETCIARMQPIGESESAEPVAHIANRAVSAFIHDGRDLSSRMYVPPESTEQEQQDEQTHVWESFLEDEVESDDEDIQIRTE